MPIQYNCEMNSEINTKTPAKPYKIPRSTLVVIYNDASEALLIERADHRGYWQSVTGSQDEGETLLETAAREVMEETGIDVRRFQFADWRQQSRYEIYAIWRHRYAPDVTHNQEHVFGLKVTGRVPITLSPHEHLQYVWLPVDQAAQLCFSSTNRQAILAIPSWIAKPGNGQ